MLSQEPHSNTAHSTVGQNSLQEQTGRRTDHTTKKVVEYVPQISVFLVPLVHPVDVHQCQHDCW